MNESADPLPPPDALDWLTQSLLECGGVLSQIVAGMAKGEASGRAAPDALPIPEAAHAVVKSALTDLAKWHSRRDLRMAARVVGEAASAIVDNVFNVDPEWLGSLLDGDGDTAVP